MDAMQECPNCHTLNRTGASFCQQCGTRLGAAQPATQIDPNAAPPALPALNTSQTGSGSRGWLIFILAAALVCVIGGGVGAFLLLGGQGFGFAALNQPSPTPAAIAGTPTLQATALPSETATAEPTATEVATNMPVKSRTPAPTPTAVPDAQVAGSNLNLRAGPGTVYNILGVLNSGDRLEILGKNITGDWVQVRAPSGQVGWAAVSLLRVNKPLSGVPVAQAPPPPTARPKPVAGGCPANPAYVSVISEVPQDIAIALEGANKYSLNLPSLRTRNVCITSGTYSYSVTAQGFNINLGVEKFDAGAPQCWRWSARSTISLEKNCPAPTDPNAYSPP